MQILTTYLRRAATVCLLAATAAAHGGQYRGPNGAVINVPAGQPVAGGPTTGGDAFLNINSWQVWWQLNHPRYVGLTGDTKDADRRDVAMPALVAALRDDQDSDVLSASLIALGKVAVDHPSLDVLAALRAHLPDGNQDVREAAILALGLSGIRAAVPDLASLLHDERPGRKLIERSKVGARARTFAAYSLGLLAQRTDDPEAADAALAALLLALDDKGLREEDVLTGVLNGVRLLADSSVPRAKLKRLRWQAIDALLTFHERRVSSKLAVAQSHALTALARLAAAGSRASRERVIERAVEVLSRGRDADASIYVSAVIALGEVAGPGDADALDVLVKHVRRPRDSLIPKFAMIAFGKIGGQVAFDQLAETFRNGKRDVVPWAAIGLGLHARGGRATPSKPAAGVGTAATKRNMADQARSVLGAALKGENRDELLAAIAIGLGLAGADSAADTLRKIALETKSEVHKGHLLVGLAMLDDKQAATVAEGGMTTVRNAVYMGHCALALAELGRRGASTLAVDRLQNTPNTRGFLTWLGASAQSIGHLKNARDLPALVETLQSRTARKSSSRRRSGASVGRLRAAITAAAMGSVADRDPLGFGARIADGMNYTMREQTLSNGKNGVLDIF